METSSGSSRIESEQIVEEMIRERWKTYNLQWMGKERFEDFIQKKIQSDLFQVRHLSFLESNLIALDKKEVLDIGCGEGGFVVALKRKGMRVLGVDLSKTALDIAHLQLSCREGFGNPSILGQVEGHHLPFRDNTFDLVTSIDTLEHIPDLPGFFKEVQRILKKGGYFYANTPNRHWPYETHCRMFLLHWIPLRFRPFIIQKFFPKRLKKLEKLEYLEALNLQTPSELKILAERFFQYISEYSEVIFNRYLNDKKNMILKKSFVKNWIIQIFLGARRIPVLSWFVRKFLYHYSPEIILIARK